MRIGKITRALLFFLFIIPRGLPAEASHVARPVYVAQSWQDYLRLVPLSVKDGYTPLLYLEPEAASDAIDWFVQLYTGNRVIVGSQDIAALISSHWPSPLSIVVVEEKRQMATVAAAIAANLQSPLFFNTLPENMPATTMLRVIAVGDVQIASNFTQVTRLETLTEAQSFYNESSQNDTYGVLVFADSPMNFLAAGVVAYHQGDLLFKWDEIAVSQPEFLAWLTEPNYVTWDNVQKLHNASSFIPGSQVYDAAIGILTGFNAHDVALLMARTYAYTDLTGPWQNHWTKGNFAATDRAKTTTYGPFTTHILNGAALTRRDFLAAMSQSAYIELTAHGSPQGFQFPGGTKIQKADISALPPLVFIAEACETADLTRYDWRTSIALQIISSGAVAYVGSMKVGGVGMADENVFAFSTPELPLGQLVRLQNVARMESDADVARVILIGDPAFHQFTQSVTETEFFQMTPVIGVKVYSDFTIPIPVHLVLPDDISLPQYAASSLVDGRQAVYIPGAVYMARPLVTVRSRNQVHVLLMWPGGKGELFLHQQRPFSVKFRRILSDCLLGQRGLLIDVFSNSPIDWVMLILYLLVAVVVWKSSAKYPATLWFGSGLAVIIGLGGVLWSALMNSLMSWPAIGAIAVLGTAGAWYATEGDSLRVGFLRGIALFAGALLPFWTLAALMGGSLHVLRLLAQGIASIGFLYGLVLGSGLLLWRWKIHA